MLATDEIARQGRRPEPGLQQRPSAIAQSMFVTGPHVVAQAATAKL
ncbi:hypothetical protein KTAU_28850 [Thermogemmatispora aurantia]|nr:hypothetical protein KTAU_28850 [Thermogemmatispora aurantia]